MADVRALPDIPTEQTDAQTGDLLYIVRSGVEAKITYGNLIDNTYSYAGTMTVTGTIDLTAGTLTLADDQIAGVKVAAATDTARGTVEKSTSAENAAGTATDVFPDVAGVVEIGGGAPHAVLEDQKTSGTNAANVGTSWTTRELNTEVRDVHSLMALSGNEFTPSQNGWVEWSAPGRDRFATRLYNVTDAVEVSTGQSRTTVSGNAALSNGGGAVEAGKTYRIEQITSVAQPAGTASSFGTEVYTRVRYWRTS